MRTIAFLGILLCCVHVYGEDIRVVPGVEGLQQLEEEGIKSRLKFRNAEAIVTYIGETKTIAPAVIKTVRKVKIVARVILDFEHERCCYVNSWQQLDDGASDKQPKYYYVIYRDGKGTDNIGMTVSSPGREGFFKYIGENDVWHVELAGMGFHQNNAVWEPEKNSEEALQLLRQFDHSKSDKMIASTRIHPNGNKEYIQEWKNTSNKSISVYDPKFILPIESIVINPVNEKPQEILHSKVEFENVNGFTRCKSFECDAIESPYPETFEKRQTTTDYQWLQFSEDNLKWPDERKIIASDESMQAFLDNKN